MRRSKSASWSNSAVSSFSMAQQMDGDGELAAELVVFTSGFAILTIFLWIFIWCIGKLQNKRNMASLDLLSSNPEEREKMEKAVQEEMARQKAMEKPEQTDQES